MKPKIFIASSVKGLTIAREVQTALDREADCTIWDQGVFLLSKYVLDNLIESLDKWDFGVFVFSGDDALELGQHNYRAVRDNVLLELGLFMGRLGKLRALIVQPRDIELRIPSDLFGLTVAEFDPKRAEIEVQAALGPACNKVLQHIRNTFIPRPGLYVKDECKLTIGEGGWRRYAGSTGTVSVYPDRVLLSDSPDDGFEFPHSPISTPADYVLFRIRRPTTAPLILYVALRCRDGMMHIAASTVFGSTGWGSFNEFNVALEMIPIDEWYPVILDTTALVSSVNSGKVSFKMRAPLEVSHIWCTDAVDEIPRALRTGKDGRLIKPFTIRKDFPAIEILQPASGGKVHFKQDVYGAVADPTRYVSVYVFAGDVWWPQPRPSIAGHNWTAQCFFGNDETQGAGDEFKLVAVASDDLITQSGPAPTLPEGDHSRVITVIRA